MPPPPPPGAMPPPPGAGFPPPGGFPPPPPGTSGWATRYGLVRPAQGRVLAGVCAAIGRATNTDPVLWRVLFAVLSLAGGLSIFLYVVGWLLIPSEGDTGSPLESLLGRGRSGTSPILVVIVAGITALAAGSFVFDGMRPALVVAAVIAIVIVVLNRRGGGQPWQAPPAAQPGVGFPPPPGYPPPPAGFPPPAEFGAPPAPPGEFPAPPAPPGGFATEPVGFATDPGTGAPEPPTYRPPFAPHGPYATGPYPYPGLAPPVPVHRPVRPPSRLGRFTLSLTLLVIGVVALVHVIGRVYVPFSAYVAAALATVGLGLLIGTWYGRSRGLIFLGVILAVTLAANTAVGDVGPLRGSAGDVTWAPVSLSELGDTYEHSFGDATLDLTQLNFDNTDRNVTVHVNAGSLHVQVPRFVDVVVHAKVSVGNANVLGSSWDGVNNPSRTVTDNDTDGPGHGRLVLDLQVNAGTLEVAR
ncbi:MAG: hypothetical protein AUI14_10980 [Actinobacteria bacterium 13_2_20CM_2_71_6]|nr:MAG: hypothetical protein AUI14_10980 [Actinobacteria bacterium 13_2_20CM_2_71_6]